MQTAFILLVWACIAHWTRCVKMRRGNKKNLVLIEFTKKTADMEP